jgi:hypothetical protein
MSNVKGKDATPALGDARPDPQPKGPGYGDKYPAIPIRMEGLRRVGVGIQRTTYPRVAGI